MKASRRLPTERRHNSQDCTLATRQLSLHRKMREKGSFGNETQSQGAHLTHGACNQKPIN